jgi:hypothetical protein
MPSTKTIAKSVVDHSKTPHCSIPILAFVPGSPTNLGRYV